MRAIFAVVLISALGMAGITTAVPPLQQVSADPDTKDKAWSGERLALGANCEKSDDGCKEFKDANGANVNKLARDDCERVNDGKCKQVH